jgi:hypothetical protein
MVVWKEAKVGHQPRQEQRQDTGTEAGQGDGHHRRAGGIAFAICVDCGGAIADVLARLGSTRCHDCRKNVPAPSALLGPAR